MKRNPLGIVQYVIRMRRLIIDGLNQEILSKCTDVDEVEFFADGTWKKVNENDKCVAKKSKQEETKKSKINNNNDDDVEICAKLRSLLNQIFSNKNNKYFIFFRYFFITTYNETK